MLWYPSFSSLGANLGLGTTKRGVHASIGGDNIGDCLFASTSIFLGSALFYSFLLVSVCDLTLIDGGLLADTTSLASMAVFDLIAVSLLVSFEALMVVVHVFNIGNAGNCLSRVTSEDTLVEHTESVILTSEF